ncbi:unnamed protein product, partial [Staurois parvus]
MSCQSALALSHCCLSVPSITAAYQCPLVLPITAH